MWFLEKRNFIVSLNISLQSVLTITGRKEQVITVGQCDLDLGSGHYIYSRHRSATHYDVSTPTSLTC